MKNNLWMFSVLIKHFPMYVIGFMFNKILIALPAYISNVLFLNVVINHLISHKPVYILLIYIVGLLAFLILVDIYNGCFVHIWQPRANEKIKKMFYDNFKNAVSRFEISVYDDPDYYDNITYISQNIFNDSIAALSYVCDIIAGIINIILILNLFATIGLCLLLISSGSVIFSLLLNIPIAKLKNSYRFKTNQINRKKQYFFNTFFDRDTFKERKMTPVSLLLGKYYDESNLELQNCYKKYGRKLFLLNFASEAFSSTFLMNFGLIAFLLYGVFISNTIGGGDFIAAYNGTNVITSTVMQIIGVFALMKNNAFTIEKYRKLVTFTQLAIPPCENSDFEVNKIELRNVSFKYPGTNRMVLKNINLTLQKGDKVAIVGKNGSGKSTLINLLMGFYWPTDGEIFVNEQLLKKADCETYRRQFAAFFQGMKPFEATVAENVALDTSIDTNKLTQVLQQTCCSSLMNDPENVWIGKNLNTQGLILSGGEYQKLMLAYCLYSKQALVVMDEPSSALDPISERNFFDQVSKFLDGKMIVFVTHRLSTVHMAKYIFVLEDGELIQEGTHSQLIKQDGLYKKMWNIQYKKYGKENG